MEEILHEQSIVYKETFKGGIGLNAIAVSPCSNPELSLEGILSAYSRVGYRQLELFTSWVHSAVDWRKDPQPYLQLAQQYGISYTSMHLPPVTALDPEGSLLQAIAAAEFAEALGVKVVLFKAESRPVYIRMARKFLNAIEGLQLVPVLQNHANSPIATLQDYKEVLQGIDDDRMMTLLEVGHFHSVGVSWRQGYELLGDSIALIHIKDQVGAQSVRFGQGEIDLLGLFAHMKLSGYSGKYVVEMEVQDHEHTLAYLADALSMIQPWVGGEVL